MEPARYLCPAGREIVLSFAFGLLQGPESVSNGCRGGKTGRDTPGDFPGCVVFKGLYGGTGPTGTCVLSSPVGRLFEQEGFPRMAAVLGFEADPVALDRLLDCGAEPVPAPPADRFDKVPDQIQVCTGVERCAGQLPEVDDLLLPSAELSDPQCAFVALDFAVRHSYVCFAPVIKREGFHGKRYRDTACHLHGDDLVVHHIVVAAEDAAAVGAVVQLLFDYLVER